MLRLAGRAPSRSRARSIRIRARWLRPVGVQDRSPPSSSSNRTQHRSALASRHTTSRAALGDCMARLRSRCASTAKDNTRCSLLPQLVTDRVTVANEVLAGTASSGRPDRSAASTSPNGTAGCSSVSPRPSPAAPAATRRSTYRPRAFMSSPSRDPVVSTSSPPCNSSDGSDSSLASARSTGRSSSSPARTIRPSSGVSISIRSVEPMRSPHPT